MQIEELLLQLESELDGARYVAKSHERDYNDAIDSFADRGTVIYLYGQYERSLRECDKLQSAINVIKERIR